jgi:hypothetical protein
MEETLAPNSNAGAEQPEETEEQIVSSIIKLKDTYEQASKDTRTEIGEIFSAYMGKIDEIQNTPYSTKDTIPKLRTEIAYIKPFIFSGEPEVEFEGVGDEDKSIAKLYEKIVNHRFRTIPNFNEKIESWVGQGVGFGTSVLKVIWKFATKKEIDPQTQQEFETVTQDEPDIEVPNFLDVYYNPIIAEIINQPCLIFRAVLPIEQVKANPAYNYTNAEGKRNADELEQSGSSQNSNNSSVLMKTDIPNAQQKATEGMVEIFEIIDNDKLRTVGNGKLLRDTPNQYGFKNAVKFMFEPNIIPNRFAGLGVGQNTMGLGKMFYRFFNQASTTVKLGNNQMSVGDKGLNIDKRQLVSKPAGHVEIDLKGRNINDVFQWQTPPQLDQPFIEMMNKVDDEHKRASGANDLLQGSATNDTLGQDQIAQSNISNRFEIIVRRFKGALSEVATMLLKMELENLQSPEASILRIFPDEMPQTDQMTGQEIMVPGFRQQIYEILINSKDDVKFNVRVKGETNVARNKNMESKRLVELFNIASGVQTEVGPLLTNKELRAILRKGLELQGEQNVDELVGEEAPQPQMPIDPNTNQAEMPRSMPNMPNQQVLPQ